MATRKRELGVDAQGRYRPCIGWCQDYRTDAVGRVIYEGVRRQPRFNLGTDRKEAERRLARIRDLHEDNCRIMKSDLWSPLALSFAKMLARGERIEYPLYDDVKDEDDPLLEYAQSYHSIKEMFPSVDFVVDTRLYAESLQHNKEYVSKGIEWVAEEARGEGALPPNGDLPREIIPGTLHEALDAYTEAIRRHNIEPGSKQMKTYGLRRLQRVERFRERHQDISLSLLDYDECKAMVDYWRNRPPRKDGKLTSRDNARHHVGELMRFFRWLDASSAYAWQLPRGLERVDRRVPKTDGERRLSAITKDIYTVEELAEINRHATPTERLVLYLGLNCAMGAAELGRLVRGDFSLHQPHPYADRLHFASSESDSFARFLRPKTQVFGEWLLWDESVRMVEWALSLPSCKKYELLFVSDRGQPWYREGTKNPHSKFSNVWKRLIERVQKSHPTFRFLPGGTLRDTLPDLLRHRYSDELASMSLAHGSPFHGDSLLECYGNKPFGRLHAALREVRSHFEPVFAASPHPTEERKHYLPIAVHEKLRQMIAEGGKVSEIARACGVSIMTVHREIKKQKD